MNEQTADVFAVQISERHGVGVGLAFSNLKDTAKQPFFRLMIVANQAEDESAAEVVPPATPTVPSLPFLRVAHENIKRLLSSIPDGEVNLVFIG
jgi:hypothetical protein